MTDPYRYTCARCGSVTVREQLSGGWYCNSGTHRTPAVWDTEKRAWVHTGRSDEATRKTSPGSFHKWPGGSGF